MSFFYPVVAYYARYPLNNDLFVNPVANDASEKFFYETIQSSPTLSTLWKESNKLEGYHFPYAFIFHSIQKDYQLALKEEIVRYFITDKDTPRSVIDLEIKVRLVYPVAVRCIVLGFNANKGGRISISNGGSPNLKKMKNYIDDSVQYVKSS
jgi:hypothetical protein